MVLTLRFLLRFLRRRNSTVSSPLVLLSDAWRATNRFHWKWKKIHNNWKSAEIKILKTTRGMHKFFNDISEWNNNYSDTLDFRRGNWGWSCFSFKGSLITNPQYYSVFYIWVLSRGPIWSRWNYTQWENLWEFRVKLDFSQLFWLFCENFRGDSEILGKLLNYFRRIIVSPNRGSEQKIEYAST